MYVLLKKLLSDFVFGNFFIALCATGMVLTTFLMYNLPLRLTPFTVFVTISTYLLYNFHRHSFKLDYSGKKELMTSVGKLQIRSSEKFFYVIASVALIVNFFFLDLRIFPYLIPLALLALTYSIPVIRRRKKKVRLQEIYFIKTPTLAIAWGLITTIIPLVEQNISLASTFVCLQVISRSLFVFALCIPFEIRDVDTDKIKNMKTLPVLYGIRQTKIIGLVVIFLEIITHHLMIPAISMPSALALDLTSLIAVVWIVLEGRENGPYFYKLFIDGTMLIRFLFLLIAIRVL